MTSAAYSVDTMRGSAATFHARTVPEPARPAVWVHDIDRPALVLGSNQDESVVDPSACARQGIEIVRRRSGGGAVLLRPGEVGWLDVVVATDGPGWTLDVQQQMVWLGERLVSVLAAEFDLPHLSVHDGPMRSTAWSRMICFDGVGAGEVLLDDAKLVGISQRRTRSWARLQCSWYRRHDPVELLELLLPEHRPPLDALRSVAVTAAGAAHVATALAPLLTA